MPDIGNIGPVFPSSGRGEEVAARPVQLNLVHPDRVPGRDSLRDETLVGRGEAPSRRERIEAIRTAIANGTYPTEEKLQLAMRRMIDELRG
ncbi:MAG: hypothetical protein ACO3EP_06715 [Phycisphaerales bacterium]|jgi:hypothetical protein